MNHYRHYVVGFFPHRTLAEKAFSRIITEGMSPRFVRIFDKYSVLPMTSIKPLKDEERQTWTSANLESLVGTGLSNLLGIKLVAANVSLIVEPSLVAPLVTLGWGGNIGIVETNFYNREDVKLLSDLVHDAILSRQIVVMVETHSSQETAIVAEIIQLTTGNLTNAI